MIVDCIAFSIKKKREDLILNISMPSGLFVTSSFNNGTTGARWDVITGGVVGRQSGEQWRSGMYST